MWSGQIRQKRPPITKLFSKCFFVHGCTKTHFCFLAGGLSACFRLCKLNKTNNHIVNCFSRLWLDGFENDKRIPMDSPPIVCREHDPREAIGGCQVKSFNVSKIETISNKNACARVKRSKIRFIPEIIGIIRKQRFWYPAALKSGNLKNVDCAKTMGGHSLKSGRYIERCSGALVGELLNLFAGIVQSEWAFVCAIELIGDLYQFALRDRLSMQPFI